MMLIEIRKKVRKGKELKTPRHASTTASCDDYVTTYNIIPVNTPFLFCIRDINRLGVKLNNLKNMLI